MSDTFNYEYLSSNIERIIKQASEIVMNYYNSSFDIDIKKDGSPVTNADKETENFISKELKSICQNIPIIGEESNNNLEMLGNTFWLIDPIDGTKGFINKNGEFTINIALIKDNEPVFGAVFAPVFDELYITESLGKAICVKEGKRYVLDNSTSKRTNDAIVQYVSRFSHNSTANDTMIKNSKDTVKITLGSSLKICRIASGIADVCAYTHPSSEWDIAAADAILRTTGGQVTTYPSGAVLTYGKKEAKLENPMLVIGNRRYNGR